MSALAVAGAVTGAGLVALALFDLGWTTVAAGSGGGPVTRRFAALLWKGALSVHRRRSGHGFLSSAGPAIVFALFGLWVLLVLAGWCLVFLGAESAVRDATTGQPAGLVDRIYFTGYTVFTLGIGDFRPGDGVWQLATVVATGSGLVLVTLGITYLVGVAAAVTQRRQLASAVATLGDDGADILVRAWDGSGFGELGQHLIELATLVDTTRHQHLAYPVLHYFHSDAAQNAPSVQLTHLCQALAALRYGVPPEHQPGPAVLGPLDRALDAFLSSLGDAYIERDAEPVPLASLDRLREAGVPACERYDSRAESTTLDRRRLLAGYLSDDGWSPDSPPESHGA